MTTPHFLRIATPPSPYTPSETPHMWLGPIATAETAQNLADRIRTTYADRATVTIHSELPIDSAGMSTLPVDDAFLTNPDLPDALLGAMDQWIAHRNTGDPTAFHNDPMGASKAVGSPRYLNTPEGKADMERRISAQPQTPTNNAIESS